MAEVLVRDETMTGREIESWVLPDLPDKLTARELVRLRVREGAGRGSSQALVPPGQLDAAAQADLACTAFERNRFVMIVDERQIEDLDEVIDVRWAPVVSFIRLVPLVGG